MIRISRFPIALLLLVTLAACSGGESTGPRTPSALAASTAASFSAAVASAVSPVPAVEVKDASGQGVPNVLVNWRIVSGNGTIQNDTSRSSASGVASVGRWTLGTAAGIQELEASVSGAGTLRFTATATAGAVSRLVRTTAEAQNGRVGEAVAVAPAVRVEDAHGNRVANINVSFSAISGGGTAIGSPKVTNANGEAAIDAWELGPTIGQQLLRAAVGTVITTFSATAEAGAPVSMEIVAGNNQEGVSGIALNAAPVVRVLDEFSNPVGGVTVEFIPGSNSGTVGSTTAVTTQPAGTANPTSWTLGDADSQTLRAQVQGSPSIGVTFNATATVSLFKITVRWIGGEPPARVQQAVGRAVDRWRKVLVGRSGVSSVVTNSGYCRSWAPAINEVVDGILLIAQVGAIDGSGSVLANANFCAVHAETGLPAYGSMLVDEADVANMSANTAIDNVLAHEMGHSIGFHSGFFGAPRFPTFVQFVTSLDPRFYGPEAVAQFLSAGGGVLSANSVPLQSTAANVAGGHWSEGALTIELMTPSISLSNPNTPLSRITVGLMRDIGYQVRYEGADPFSISSALYQQGTSPRIPLGHDVAPIVGGELKVAPTVRRVR